MLPAHAKLGRYPIVLAKHVRWKLKLSLRAFATRAADVAKVARIAHVRPHTGLSVDLGARMRGMWRRAGN